MLETNVSNFNCFGALTGCKMSIDIHKNIINKIMLSHITSSTRIPTKAKWENKKNVLYPRKKKHALKCIPIYSVYCPT